MIRNYYNTVDLLNVLYNAMIGISSNIFTSNRPKESEAMDDLVVVAFPVRIVDRGGFGATSCRISLYARDNSHGENLPVLKVMQEEVYKRLPIVTDKYSITSPIPINAGSDGLGFHCLHIQCDVIINHT